MSPYVVTAKNYARMVAAAMAGVMLGLVGTPALAAPPPLQDQNGKTGSMEDFSGKPVIVFVTSLTQLANLGKWEEAIRPEVPNINSMDVGDIEKAPGFIREKVVEELKKHVPDGVSVYVDEENLWAKEYQLDLGKPCVLVFDENHDLVNQFRGKPQGKLLDEVIAAAKVQFPSAESST